MIKVRSNQSSSIVLNGLRNQFSGRVPSSTQLPDFPEWSDDELPDTDGPLVGLDDDEQPGDSLVPRETVTSTVSAAASSSSSVSLMPLDLMPALHTAQGVETVNHEQHKKGFQEQRRQKLKQKKRPSAAKETISDNDNKNTVIT